MHYKCPIHIEKLYQHVEKNCCATSIILSRSLVKHAIEAVRRERSVHTNVPTTPLCTKEVLVETFEMLSHCQLIHAIEALRFEASRLPATTNDMFNVIGNNMLSQFYDIVAQCVRQGHEQNELRECSAQSGLLLLLILTRSK